MRVGNLPYLELVQNGDQRARWYRTRGIPAIADIDDGAIYTLDLTKYPILTEQFRAKFHGREINAEFMHDIALWLTEEARKLL